MYSYKFIRITNSKSKKGSQTRTEKSLSPSRKSVA
jgi:hypothetical protein